MKNVEMTKRPRREGIQGQIDYHIQEMIQKLEELLEGGGPVKDERLWNMVKVFAMDEIYKEMICQMVAGYPDDAKSTHAALLDVIMSEQ